MTGLRTGGQGATRQASALVVTILVSVPLVAGFFGWVHPALDSFSHLRPYFSILLFVCAAWLLWTGVRLHGLVAGLLAIGGFASTLHVPFGEYASADVAGEQPVLPRYTHLHLNVRFANPEPEKVIALITRLRPDVVSLNEVDKRWVERLAAVDDLYPNQIWCGTVVRTGEVMILSRRPFLRATEEDCASKGRFLVATVDFSGQAVDVAAMHFRWPWPFSQPREVDAMLPRFRALGDVSILAGDFNATPWSYSLRRVLSEGGFAGASWLEPTWLHEALPKSLRPYLGLPIDHVLHKKGIVMQDVRVLPEAGSDHLPVLTVFSILPAAGADDAMTVVSAEPLQAQ